MKRPTYSRKSITGLIKAHSGFVILSVLSLFHTAEVFLYHVSHLTPTERLPRKIILQNMSHYKLSVTTLSSYSGHLWQQLMSCSLWHFALYKWQMIHSDKTAQQWAGKTWKDCVFLVQSLRPTVFYTLCPRSAVSWLQLKHWPPPLLFFVSQSFCDGCRACVCVSLCTFFSASVCVSCAKLQFPHF